MSSNNILSASFRDPSGFMFRRDNKLYRQVNQSYHQEYDQLVDSGLYKELCEAGLMISHEEVNIEPEITGLAYKVVQPEPVGFISYPYEWSFSQLKDAALTTLEIERRALERGMSLKDASAYNIQFVRGRPMLIDTLSFETYRQGQPWVAYRQFCQHFLAPLAMMAYRDVRFSQLLRVFIDGAPLDLVSKMLPSRTRWDFSLLTHIHLHAAAQQRYSGKTLNKAALSRQMSKLAFLGLIDSLHSAVQKLKWKPAGTAWAEYYEDTNYSPGAMEHKRQVVAEYLGRIKPACLWDLGANTGLFSRIASNQGISTYAFDIDPGAVEINYLSCKKNKETNLLPLVIDLTNPSPNIGWQNKERMSFIERGPVDTVMALALVHHLAISNNVPLPMLADFFNSLCNWLIIEFIPKTDSQVERLLSTRVDIFADYHFDAFEKAFSQFFSIKDSITIHDSERRLYLMQKR